MASIPRVVPWTSPQEYQNVYQWLYSDSPELRELGVKRVKAWSSRGKIPQSIVFTAAFVEASLRDEFAFGKIKISNYELRLLYSMAFIRFVNGIIDPNQGKYAKSVASIAHKLDMPSWFVDLRHAGTHEHLPSLQVLRKGCQQALKWLEDKYWTAQKPIISTQIDEIRSLIIDYKKYSKDPDSNKKISTNNVLKKISNLITAEYIKDLLVPVLLENGYLIPKGKKKRSSRSNTTLSMKLIEIWFPMLQKFGYEWPTFYDELVQEMLEKLISNDEGEIYINFSDQLEIFQTSESSQPKNISSSYLFTLVAWISHFLEISYAKKNNSFIKLDLENILEFCLRNPNLYTKMILEFMTNHDEDLRENIAPFMIYIDKIDVSKNNQSNLKEIPIFTDEDMEKEVWNLRKEFNKTFDLKQNSKDSSTTENSLNKDSNLDSAWKLYNPDEWKKCPMGCLPNGLIPCLDFSLDLDGPSIFIPEPLDDDVDMMLTGE